MNRLRIVTGTYPGGDRFRLGNGYWGPRVKGGSVIAIAALLTLAACENPEIEPNMASTDSIVRGKAAAEALGCGACHALPGIEWPRGTTGPSLETFRAQAMIAGRLPNRPDTLAAFVRNAPSLAPGTAMPAIAMTDAQAADIAAYLQAGDAR